MQGQKTFTIDEARELLPTLRNMLQEANADLAERLEVVSAANKHFEQAESNLEKSDVAEGLDELRSARAEFQNSIEELSKAQTAYLSSLNQWLDQISSTGVILRDLREGLLDFPAEANGFNYLLCWRMDEADVNFWHLENDGFIGRKPLTSLQEYF
jgi:hypothetical protein